MKTIKVKTLGEVKAIMARVATKPQNVLEQLFLDRVYVCTLKSGEVVKMVYDGVRGEINVS